MIDTANLRQLISLDGNGTTFRGTYHRVPDDRDLPQAEVNSKAESRHLLPEFSDSAQGGYRRLCHLLG